MLEAAGLEWNCGWCCIWALIVSDQDGELSLEEETALVACVSTWGLKIQSVQKTDSVTMLMPFCFREESNSCSAFQLNEGPFSVKWPCLLPFFQPPLFSTRKGSALFGFVMHWWVIEGYQCSGVSSLSFLHTAPYSGWTGYVDNFVYFCF